MFILQGIENKKIAEIAKIREEVQAELKSERDRYEQSLVSIKSFYIF